MRSLALVLALAAAVATGGCAEPTSPPGPTETAASTAGSSTAPPAVPTGTPEREAGVETGAQTESEARAGSEARATTETPAGGPATTARPTPTPCPASGAIEDAAWTQADGGRSLAVSPAQDLRDCAGPLVRWDGIPPGWAEVVELAGPEADTGAMQQQYVCHLRFARAKETWNLEPWRPEVGEEELLRARCNP